MRNRIVMFENDRFKFVSKSKHMRFYEIDEMISGKSVVIAENNISRLIKFTFDLDIFIYTCNLFQKGNNEMNIFGGRDVYFKLKEASQKQINAVKESYPELFI